MLAFLTNKVSFFSYFFKYFAFLTHIRKIVLCVKYLLKMELYGTLIREIMWILADEACCGTNFSNIMS